jgi:membrane associated rhomboid family serine protease
VIILFPVGVEDAEVNRLPWVSIGIAALCVIAFLFSWVLPANPQGVDNSALFEVLTYWQQHSYLELPEPFQSRFIPKNAQQKLKLHASDQRPEPEIIQKEQATLDEMVSRVIALSDRSILRRFSLIPAKGMFQIGWLTHMFLHFGWLHLLGNLFFFYLVGPLIEDIWGRPLFAGFYLVGGLAAALAHFLLDHASPTMMAGASGAIAACMGAFALRYATRRIRLAYFVWFYFRIWRGITRWPAWVCGLLWFFNEAWNFWRTGGNSGVAVMAHIGGFAFGAAVAFGLRTSGIESKYVAPKVEATFTWQKHPAIEKAAAALERKDLPTAEAAYREVLAADPKNLEAQFGLAKIAIQQHRVAEGIQRLDPLLGRLIARSEQDKAMGWIEDIVPVLDPQALRPALAFKIGQLIDAGPEGLRPLGERFYARAGEAGAVLGAKALIRAAAITLSVTDQAEAALRHLARAEAIPELPAECKTQLAELRAEAERRQSSAGAFRPNERLAEAPATSTPHARATIGPSGATAQTSSPQARTSAESALSAAESNAAPRPLILGCRLKQIRQDGLDIDVQSQSAIVTWNRITAIGVGVIPSGPPGAEKNVVVTDLLVSSKKNGARPTVLRLPGGALGLDTLFPGIRPRDAFQQLIAELLTRSGARPLSNPDGLSSGKYPRFADISEMESAFYGAAA